MGEKKKKPYQLAAASPYLACEVGVQAGMYPLQEGEGWGAQEGCGAVPGLPSNLLSK